MNASGGNDWFWAPDVGGLMTVHEVVRKHLGDLEPKWTNFLLQLSAQPRRQVRPRDRQAAARRGRGLDPERRAPAPAGAAARRTSVPVHAGVGHRQQRRCRGRDRRQERHRLHQHVGADGRAAAVDHAGSRAACSRTSAGSASCRATTTRRAATTATSRRTGSPPAPTVTSFRRGHRWNLAGGRQDEGRHLRPGGGTLRPLRDPRRQRQAPRSPKSPWAAVPRRFHDAHGPNCLPRWLPCSPALAGARVADPRRDRAEVRERREIPCRAWCTRTAGYALLVDGAPFLILGAQVNNSSAWPAVLPAGVAGDQGHPRQHRRDARLLGAVRAQTGRVRLLGGRHAGRAIPQERRSSDLALVRDLEKQRPRLRRRSGSSRTRSGSRACSPRTGARSGRSRRSRPRCWRRTSTPSSR